MNFFILTLKLFVSVSYAPMCFPLVLNHTHKAQ